MMVPATFLASIKICIYFLNHINTDQTHDTGIPALALVVRFFKKNVQVTARTYAHITDIINAYVKIP